MQLYSRQSRRLSSQHMSESSIQKMTLINIKVSRSGPNHEQHPHLNRRLSFFLYKSLAGDTQNIIIIMERQIFVHVYVITSAVIIIK